MVINDYTYPNGWWQKKSVCPTCGHCPTCGRPTYPSRPQVTWYSGPIDCTNVTHGTDDPS